MQASTDVVAEQAAPKKLTTAERVEVIEQNLAKFSKALEDLTQKMNQSQQQMQAQLTSLQSEVAKKSAEGADTKAIQEQIKGLSEKIQKLTDETIKKIDEIIGKIDSGDYGYCESCGIEIGLKRLEARPTATLCIDCKTLDEMRERQIAK